MSNTVLLHFGNHTLATLATRGIKVLEVKTSPWPTYTVDNNGVRQNLSFEKIQRMAL